MLKKAFKILGLILLSTLLLFGALFLIINSKYANPLPTGTEGEQAEELAQKILKSLNYDAYKATTYLSWTFRNHSYVWNKSKNEVLVTWESNSVLLSTKDKAKSTVKSPTNLSESERNSLISSAESSFNNDSFWVIAPYKILDEGVVRKYIPASDTENASLLITYSSGGTTPGDSYQWFLDKDFTPTKFRMWVSILPIDGLTTTWKDWKETSTGAKIATSRTIIDFLPLPISDIKSYNN